MTSKCAQGATGSTNSSRNLAAVIAPSASCDEPIALAAITAVEMPRPIVAKIIAAAIVAAAIVGGMSVGSMPIREFPAIERPIVSITTDYRGAASDIVERRVTQVLEDQLAGIAGITKISSVSFDERSRITLEFSRDRDIDGAANDVRDRVSSIVSMLPDEAEKIPGRE